MSCCANFLNNCVDLNIFRLIFCANSLIQRLKSEKVRVHLMNVPTHLGTNRTWPSDFSYPFWFSICDKKIATTKVCPEIPDFVHNWQIKAESSNFRIRPQTIETSKFARAQHHELMGKHQTGLDWKNWPSIVKKARTVQIQISASTKSQCLRKIYLQLVVPSP